MYKVVTKDQYGKEHGKPVYTPDKNEALFVYSFTKAGDGVTGQTFITRNEQGKKQVNGIVLTTSLFELDQYGQATDITPTK